MKPSIFLMIILLISCSSNPFDCKKIINDKDLDQRYGAPKIDTIELSKETKLYEYQNGLNSIISDLKTNDTIKIIEKKWTENPFVLVKWYNNKSTTVIDCLSWNQKKQQF